MEREHRTESTQAELARLHIAVGSAPLAPIGAGVRKDLALVKAALLYADRITLRSPNTMMLLAVAALKNLTMDEQVSFVVDLAPVLDPVGGVALAEELRAIRERATNRASRRKLTSKIGPAFKGVRSKAIELLRTYSADDLIRATELGLLEVKPFDMGHGGAVAASIRQTLGSPNAADGPDVAQQYVDGVLEDIRDPGMFPMLDGQTKRLVNAGVREGLFTFTEAELRRGQHVALAGQLFERLPVFERASLDELIDIRTELQAPLIRFRSAMIRFSAALKEAPWGDDFRSEAELILLREVEPALTELNELVKENSYLQHLVDAVVQDAGRILGALGLAVAGQEQLPGGLLNVAPHVTAAMMGARAAWKAEAKRKQLHKEATGHELYFMYRLYKSRS